MSAQRTNQEPESSRQHLGIIARPLNLLRTVAAGFPVTSSLTEVLDQIQGERVDKRLAALENSDSDLAIKVRELEQSQAKEPAPTQDWPRAVSEFVSRLVNVGVFYDGQFDSPEQKGKELFVIVGHGCFVGPKTVLTSAEVIEWSEEIAKQRKGAIRIVAADSVRYDVEIEKGGSGFGLASLLLTSRNEDDFKREMAIREKYEKHGVRSYWTEPLETPVEFSVMPYMGQEIGFLHTGEATDIMGWPKVQFDTTVISHFKKPSEKVLKSFVTGVLASRFLHAGAPVFTRKGTLVGIIADSDCYDADAGRRAIVRSLLGHPRFSKKTA